MMVEAGGVEDSWRLYEAGAPKVTEEVLTEGLEAAKAWIRASIELQRELVARAGRKPTIAYELLSDYADDVFDRVQQVGRRRRDQGQHGHRQDRAQRGARRGPDFGLTQLGSEFPDREREIKAAVRALTKKLVRKRIVEEGVRIDGRGTADIRPLSAEVGVIPTAHGSGLFERERPRS